MKFVHSAPPAELVFEISDAEYMSWYRMSICVGKNAVVTEIKPITFNYKNNLIGQGWDGNYVVSNSFEDLQNAQVDSYWHDTQRGWIHMKIIQTEDRTLGGTITERDSGNTYTYGDDPGWTDFNDVGIGSRWRFNMETGEHQIEIYLDPASLDGEAQCDDFTETKDACIGHTCHADAQCINEGYTYRCECNQGFEMNEDGETCERGKSLFLSFFVQYLYSI